MGGDTVREFWKNTAVMAAIGFVAGLLVGLAFLLLYGIGAYYAQYGAGRFALHLAISGLVGLVNMGTTTIYGLEHWSLLRCTLTHFAITMACLCLIGFPMDWFSLHDPYTPWILGGCVVVYFIIWLVMSLHGKRQVRRINEALKTWKDRQGEE